MPVAAVDAAGVCTDSFVNSLDGVDARESLSFPLELVVLSGFLGFGVATVIA